MQRDEAIAKVNAITVKVGQRFPSFGGGNGSDWNPIAAALKDKPLQFAAGVDIDEVVQFVIGEVLSLVNEVLDQKNAEQTRLSEG